METALLERVKDLARLAALRESSLLDTPPEKAFDRLTRLVTKILHVPVALASLVAEDYQFFKSCPGVPEPLATVRRTPLSHSFCQYAVGSGEPLVVEDARRHPLLKNNRAVTEMKVVAYAGVPLATPQGFVLGSFCAIDTRPRAWTADEVAILRDLSASVMAEVELLGCARRARLDAQERQRLAAQVGRERSRVQAVLERFRLSCPPPGQHRGDSPQN